MAARSGTDCDVVAAQERMLRLAERDYGLTIAVLEAETGVPSVTLRTYKRDTMMPLATFVKLCAVIPDNLTSLVLEPAGKAVCSPESVDGDIDELAHETSALTFEILDAKRDGRIDHVERERIKDRARKVEAVSRRITT
jgi:hypothetical protein